MRIFRALVLVLSLCPLSARAAISPDAADRASDRSAIDRDANSPTVELRRTVSADLAKSYPGSRIELGSQIQWTRGSLPERIQSVAVFDQGGPRAEVSVRVEGRDANDGYAIAEGLIPFEAWLPAYVAVHRVFPAEKLADNGFAIQEVDVASGAYRELRGLIVPPNAMPLSSLQSRQTVLEGTVLLSSSVERIPDVRRGDAVRITVDADSGLTLTVPGTAQEPAYLNGRVRVLTDHTKRGFMGELQPGGVVEVKL